MLRAGLLLLSVGCALMLALMIAAHSGWTVFGPCGPDLFGYLLLGGAFLSMISGLTLLLMGLVVAGVRKARNRAAI